MSKKKDFLKKNQTAITIVAVVIVLSIIILSFSSNSEVNVSETDDSKISSSIADLVPSEITCVYLGDSVKYGPFGQYGGRVLNQGDTVISDVTIKVEFFDANGRSVGTHETSIVGDKIEPGMERPFFSYTGEGDLSGEFETCKATIQ